MAIDLVDYERKGHEAIRAFWGNRRIARQKQIESGKADQGERAGVTAGKNMDGFIALILDIIRANGLGVGRDSSEKVGSNVARIFPTDKTLGFIGDSQRGTHCSH